MDKKLSYLEYHLLSLGNEFLKSDIKLNDVNKSFNYKTDFNSSAYALEELLAMNNKEAGNNLSKKAQVSINAFKDLDGENWYPVIRKIKNGDDSIENSLFLISMYDEKKKKEIVNSYQINTDTNELILTRSDVNEEDIFSNQKSSNTNSVFTLAIRPCIEQLRKSTDRISEEDCGATGGGGGGGGWYPPTVNGPIKLEKIKIKIKKESWVERAEVHIIHYQWDKLRLNEDLHYLGVLSNFEGRQLAKFRSRDVKRGNTKNVNATLNVEKMRGFFNYVIFESDNWPAQVRKAITYNSTNRTSFELQFRSWEPEFATQALEINGNTNGFRGVFRFKENNSQIEYNFK